MAPTSQETPAAADGRTWRQYFPKGDLWVFGYGSLIWKPPPHYGMSPPPPGARVGSIADQLTGPTIDQRVPGYIEGYVRRFWQASSDHRGTPEQPGRVVTVIERNFWETLDDPLSHLESSTTRVWGAAYHIPTFYAEEVHDYLDVREIDGYSVHYTPFHPVTTTATAVGTSTDKPPSATPMTCMVYIGQPSNPQFLRDPARRDPQDVAEVISRGVGQSGKNTEYLYLLEKALEEIGLGSADEHVTDLVRRVRAIEGVEEAGKEEEKAKRDVRVSLEVAERGGRNDEGEEDLAEIHGYV